jgi:hypothetical protein
VEIDADGKATSIEYVHVPVEKPQTEVSHV